MKGTTIPATSHNLWTGSRAIWLGVIIFGMAGQRVCDLYAYGLVQHIPHKSSTAQIYYATTFAGFYFPFADPARIFRGHMLKPFYINANTRTFRSMLIYIYIYIWYPPPHVPTPVFSISALGRDGFLSCRTAWVNGRKSACKSYVSSFSSSAKLSPRTKIGRIQRYSKRILLNTPRIQDSRFKVPGRTLPCTLNLESWIRGVFNRIRFEYV